MTYPEWEEKYVVKTQKLPKNPHASKAVLVDITPGTNGGDTVKVYDGEKIPKMATDDKGIEWPAPNPNNVITREQYKELRDYASEKGIALFGFKKFDGDIELIKESIDTLSRNLMEFPGVADAKHPLTLELARHLNSDDFAETNGRIISINADAYRNKKRLEDEYQKLVDDGWFVKGTTYKSIIDHEFGHALDFVYKVNAAHIIKRVTGLEKQELVVFLKKNLSRYAAAGKKGIEITSELWVAMRSGNDSQFVLKYFEEYRKIIKKRV